MSSPRFVVAVALVLTAACSFEGKKSKEDANDEPVVAANVSTDSANPSVDISASRNGDSARRASAPNFAEGPGGEVWMKTTTGAMLMRLRHDSVLVGFSDSLRRSVNHDVDSSFKKDASSDNDKSALGRVVKSAVQATVQSALSEVFDKERGFPVSDLKDAQYHDGRIVFKYRNKPAITPDNVKNDGKSMLEQFNPSDAARFVGAVRARIADR